MKDVAGMLAEKYGATADEIVAAPTTYNRILHIAILTGKKDQTKNRQTSSTIKP